MEARGTVSLREGREKSVLRGHPWIFSGAVAGVGGEPAAGDVVRVEDSSGRFLGWGHYSPASQIRVRLLERAEGSFPDEAWWERRLVEALERRRLLPEGEADALRLVYAESDGLPGLIVDRYGPFGVLQALTAGADRLKGELARRLLGLAGLEGVWERSDAEVRRLEGLDPSAGRLAGAEPPERIRIAEGGRVFLVDARGGQKTGFFLDQRRNRLAVAAWAKGRRVLDCFAYTGAFSVHAAAAGAASLTLVDSSETALADAATHLRLNGAESLDCELIVADAFSELRALRDAARSFDLAVLDPPKLAPTRAHAERALRAYKDLNLLSMKLLAPGGILATFSCSGGIDAAQFREMLSWAALDAGREVEVLERLAQGPDHPVRLSVPETEYLKGLVLRVL